MPAGSLQTGRRPPGIRGGPEQAGAQARWERAEECIEGRVAGGTCRGAGVLPGVAPDMWEGSGSAASGGNDKVSLSVGGSATAVSNNDSKIHLAKFWNTTEWGVFGDGNGSSAIFGSNTTLEAQTALTATSKSAPTCVKEGFTGETNNLRLAHTPALGSEPSPTMASRQTNGTTGTASCATAS